MGKKNHKKNETRMIQVIILLIAINGVAWSPADRAMLEYQALSQIAAII